MSSHDELQRLVADTFDYLTGGFRRRTSEETRGGDPSTEASSTGVVSAGAAGHTDASAGLDSIAKEIASCESCRLCATRRNTVPGEGVSDPLVMVVGEGPGADEDATGRPFVGRAGNYLDKWLKAIDLNRTTKCFIANIVKCRPPQNRDPQPDERESCRHFLDRQIELLSPTAILTVGRIATQSLLDSHRGIGALRGTRYEYKRIPVIATYHPSGVLRNPEYRQAVWDDLRLLKGIIDSPDE